MKPDLHTRYRMYLLIGIGLGSSVTAALGVGLYVILKLLGGQ